MCIRDSHGPVRALLTGERVALNFLGHLSGVATATATLAAAVAGTRARICCTRKTTPGLRALEKAAVVAGGGVNHRFGLDDAVPVSYTHLDVYKRQVLVTGGALGVDCASDWAQGGLAAAVGPDDDVDMHVADTLAAGAGLCDEDAVRRIVAAAPAVVEHLVALGARFDRYDDGTLRLGLEGAHSRHRIVHADGDGSGHEITRAVADAVRAADHVTVLEHTVARRLRTADDAPGAPIVAIELATAAGTTILPTDAVLLATGGAGALFAHTTNPRGSWGSGLALGPVSYTHLDVYKRQP